MERSNGRPRHKFPHLLTTQMPHLTHLCVSFASSWKQKVLGVGEKKKLKHWTVWMRS